jgi:HD-like signal output (HDOD) protein
MSRTLEIIRALRTTPPLPSISLRVLDLVRDPEFEIDELVGLVRTDPSLTARVLKLTNSALLSLASEVPASPTPSRSSAPATW